MHFLKKIFAIFIVMLGIIIADLISYNYDGKINSIESISSKIPYVVPAFSFSSNEYKGFVYDQ